MTEGNYSPSEQSGYQAGGENSGGNGIYHMPEPSLEQRTEPGYSSDNAREMHKQSMAQLERKISTLPRSNKIIPQKELMKKYNELIESVGLDLEYVPDSLKPMAVKLVNYLKNPDKRFELEVGNLESVITEFDTAYEEINRDLYGIRSNDRSFLADFEMGGLYLEKQNLLDNRLESSLAIKQIDGMLKDTHENSKKTKLQRDKSIKECDYTLMRKLNKDLVMYGFDDKKLNRQRDKLQENVLSCIDKVSLLSEQINTLEEYQKTIVINKSIAQTLLDEANNVRKENKYNKIGTVDLAKMQDIVSKVETYVAANSERNGRRLDVILNGLDSTINKKPRINRQHSTERIVNMGEARRDRADALIDDIISNPYPDDF